MSDLDYYIDSISENLKDLQLKLNNISNSLSLFAVNQNFDGVGVIPDLSSYSKKDLESINNTPFFINNPNGNDLLTIDQLMLYGDGNVFLSLPVKTGGYISDDSDNIIISDDNIVVGY